MCPIPPRWQPYSSLFEPLGAGTATSPASDTFNHPGQPCLPVMNVSIAVEIPSTSLLSLYLFFIEREGCFAARVRTNKHVAKPLPFTRQLNP